MIFDLRSSLKNSCACLVPLILGCQSSELPAKTDAKYLEAWQNSCQEFSQILEKFRVPTNGRRKKSSDRKVYAAEIRMMIDREKIDLTIVLQNFDSLKPPFSLLPLKNLTDKLFQQVIRDEDEYKNSLSHQPWAPHRTQMLKKQLIKN